MSCAHRRLLAAAAAGRVRVCTSRPGRPLWPRPSTVRAFHEQRAAGEHIEHEEPSHLPPLDANALHKQRLKRQAKDSSRCSSPSSPSSRYSPVIGLEVHCQVLAASKLFSASSTAFGAAPNSHTSLIDAALPGTLPTLNAHCVTQCIRTALALHSTPQPLSRFERKHYFYCDLPQGYQITQQQWPVIRGGRVGSVRIDRVQLEQDSGKSIHDLSPDHSYVDLNRAGVALLEVVTLPDIRSAEEAAAFVRQLSELLRHVGVCRAQMEDGSMRVDVNVSVNKGGEERRGERVEVKNLNSLRSVVRAIDHEVQRQSALRESGQEVKRETRTFDARSGLTLLLRSKESLLDYRFMPEPDLPCLRIDDAEVQRVRAEMGETREELLQRLRQDYGLSEYDAHVLVSEAGAVDFFERLVHGEEQASRKPVQGSSKRPQLRSPKLAVSWLTTELFGRFRRLLEQSAKAAHGAVDHGEEDEQEDAATLRGEGGRAGGSRVFLLSLSPVSSVQLGSILDLMSSGQISGRTGKAVLDEMMEGNGELAPFIVRRRGWQQSSSSSLLALWVDAALQREDAAVQRYLASANPRLLAFLIGQVIKESGGKANPSEAAKRVRDSLDQLQAAAAGSSSSTTTP